MNPHILQLSMDFNGWTNNTNPRVVLSQTLETVWNNHNSPASNPYYDEGRLKLVYYLRNKSEFRASPIVQNITPADFGNNRIRTFDDLVNYLIDNSVRTTPLIDTITENVLKWLGSDDFFVADTTFQELWHNNSTFNTSGLSDLRTTLKDEEFYTGCQFIKNIDHVVLGNIKTVGDLHRRIQGNCGL